MFFKRPFSIAARAVFAAVALAVVAVAGLWVSGALAPTGAGSRGEEPASAAGELTPLAIIGANQTFEFQVELADTDAERAQGLMFRRSLAPDRGMLFDFDVEREVNMWMRNTYIPLDMIFAGANGTIINIARRTTPHSEEIISSGGPVRYVLEVPGGTASRLGIVPGDKLSPPAAR